MPRIPLQFHQPVNEIKTLNQLMAAQPFLNGPKNMNNS